MLKSIQENVSKITLDSDLIFIVDSLHLLNSADINLARESSMLKKQIDLIKDSQHDECKSNSHVLQYVWDTIAQIVREKVKELGTKLFQKRIIPVINNCMSNKMVDPISTYTADITALIQQMNINSTVNTHASILSNVTNECQNLIKSQVHKHTIIKKCVREHIEEVERTSNTLTTKIKLLNSEIKELDSQDMYTSLINPLINVHKHLKFYDFKYKKVFTMANCQEFINKGKWEEALFKIIQNDDKQLLIEFLSLDSLNKVTLEPSPTSIENSITFIEYLTLYVKDYTLDADSSDLQSNLDIVLKWLECWVVLLDDSLELYHNQNANGEYHYVISNLNKISNTSDILLDASRNQPSLITKKRMKLLYKVLSNLARDIII